MQQHVNMASLYVVVGKHTVRTCVPACVCDNAVAGGILHGRLKQSMQHRMWEVKSSTHTEARAACQRGLTIICTSNNRSTEFTLEKKPGRKRQISELTTLFTEMSRLLGMFLLLVSSPYLILFLRLFKENMLLTTATARSYFRDFTSLN